jgi:hypothetical protein
MHKLEREPRVVAARAYEAAKRMPANGERDTGVSTLAGCRPDRRNRTALTSMGKRSNRIGSFAVSFPHLLPPSVSLFDGHGVRIVAKAAMNYLLVNR